MKKYKFNYFLFLIAIIFIQSCTTRPPENPDNICLIFKEKKIGIRQQLEVRSVGKYHHMS